MDHVVGPLHILLAKKEGRIWFNIIELSVKWAEERVLGLGLRKLCDRPKSGAGVCSYKKTQAQIFWGTRNGAKKHLLLCCERAPGIQRFFVRGPTPDAHDEFRVLMMGLGPRISHPKTSRPALTLNPGLVYYAPEFKSLTLRFHGFVWIVHSKSVKTQAHFTDTSTIAPDFGGVYPS